MFSLVTLYANFRNPFVKFISHSASYILFLGLLAMASQRVEYLITEILGKISITATNRFFILYIFVVEVVQYKSKPERT